MVAGRATLRTRRLKALAEEMTTAAAAAAAKKDPTKVIVV